MAAFDAAGVKLYTLTYDEVDALADYSNAMGVTFTMLSDPNSEVIRAFGILNTLIPPDEHPWYGIPFPGAYAIDADGIIVAKFFDRNFGARFGPEQLLNAALGRRFEVEPAASPAEQVSVDLILDADRLLSGVIHEIVATFRVPEGQHLYGEPVPDGLVAATIEVDDAPGIVSRTLVAPPTSRLTLAGSGDTLEVYEGDVVLRLPIAQNGSAMQKADGKRYVDISGRVRWQACDDVECGLPRSQSFDFRVEAGFPVLPDMGPGVGRVPEMNGAAHFKKMMERKSMWSMLNWGTVMGIDAFCDALEIPLLPLPEVRAGEPTRYRPAEAIDDGAWVPMIPNDGEGENEADVYDRLSASRRFVPNVIRAMSLVPDAVRNLLDLLFPFYLAGHNPKSGSLDRRQTELVAGRLSALNECFY